MPLTRLVETGNEKDTYNFFFARIMERFPDAYIDFDNSNEFMRRELLIIPCSIEHEIVGQVVRRYMNHNGVVIDSIASTSYFINESILENV